MSNFIPYEGCENVRNHFIDKPFKDLTADEIKSMVRGKKGMSLDSFLKHYGISPEEYGNKLASMNMWMSREERLACKVTYSRRSHAPTGNKNPFNQEKLYISRVEMVAIRLFRGFSIKEMAERIGLSKELTENAEKYNSFCSEHIKDKYLQTLRIKKSELTRIRLALSGEVEGIEIDREIPSVIREEVYKKYGSKCATCGKEELLHLHHMKKYSEGGQHEIDNLVLLCSDCHAEEHKDDKEYRLLKSISERLSKVVNK